MIVVDVQLKALIMYNRGTIKYRMGSFVEALPDLQFAVDKAGAADNPEFQEALDTCKDSLPTK